MFSPALVKNINIEVEDVASVEVWPLSFMGLSQNCYGGPLYRGSNNLKIGRRVG